MNNERKLSNQEKVEALFNPNDLGKSDWIPVEKFVPAGLKWSGNGSARHGVFFNVKFYLWEKQSLGNSNRITHLRTTGIRSEKIFDQTINLDVKKYFQEKTVCGLSLMPIPSALREIDHRYGNKEHPDYVYLYSKENQKSEYFQLIFSVLNSQKRQICIQCCSTKTRPKHPSLPFVEGDESHSPNFPCSGCYLAEPERYRGVIEFHRSNNTFVTDI